MKSILFFMIIGFIIGVLFRNNNSKLAQTISRWAQGFWDFILKFFKKN